MAVRHPENFLELRWQRQTSILMTEEMALLDGPRSRRGKFTETSTQASWELLEIELHLTRGHELFRQRRHAGAIDEYKQARGLIYNKLFPRLGRRYLADLDLSAGTGHFHSILEVGLEYVEALAPKGLESHFGSATGVDPDPLAKPREELGIEVIDDAPSAVRRESRLAARYAERGQWDQALGWYRQAQKTLGKPASAEGLAVQAALEVSLGGVLVQKGDTEVATRLLTEVVKLFKKLNDPVGEAQALNNLAAAHARSGQPDKAKALLKQVRELVEQAQGFGDANSSFPNAPTSFGTVPAASIPSISAQAALGEIGSLDLNSLSQLADAKGLAVTFRHPGRGGGWSSQPLETAVEAAERVQVKQLGIQVGNRVFKARWNSGQRILASEVEAGLYKRRVKTHEWRDLRVTFPESSALAVYLPHLYHYVIPVALGDCYNALGDFPQAEINYLTAADYGFINERLEVPALWEKLAENVLEWGDVLYRGDDPIAALKIYRKVLEPPGSGSVVPNSAPLFAHAKLSAVGDRVREMLEGLTDSGASDMNPDLASVVLEIRVRVLQLHAGLDFLGHPSDLVPIWSFEYLQNVARYFAQQAVQSEREYIQFWDRGENEELTVQQLEQASALASVEEDLATEQWEAAFADVKAYEAGTELARLRADNSQSNRADYADLSAQRVYNDAAMATLGAGSNVKWSTIEGHIRRLEEEGETSGERGHLIGAHALEQGRMTRTYELAAMNRQSAEMEQALVAANRQLDGAAARLGVADQLREVARLKKQAAAENLQAFEEQLFTADVWYRMGRFMRGISTRYLHMAVRVARLMQRAYNFENDVDRRFIKTDYSTNTVKGMLGANALQLDIDAFTHDLLTTGRRKEMPVKQSLSLAQRFPFLFETEFRRTGRMTFETRLEDFDRDHPGTYARRLQRIEVEVRGILPSTGLRGRLTSGGISRYRTPAGVDKVKFRIQPKETLVLSEYRVRRDAIAFTSTDGQLGIFEGAGVAGTWEFEIPRFANDVDFASVFDVVLHFHYQARYDAGLAAQVADRLASLDGINSRSRAIPLRWAFPDSFFHLQDTGELVFRLEPHHFPYNELRPTIRRVGLLLAPERGESVAGWNVRLAVPEHPETLVASAGDQGEVSSDDGHPWRLLENGAATGEYRLELRSDENPGVDLGNLHNLALMLEYDYEPRV